MRFLFYIPIVFLLSALPYQAQVGMGQWRMHIPPNNAKGIVIANNAVYMALEKGMLEYDLEAGEKTLWTAANFLSSPTLTAIGHEPESNTVIIGYSNGNVDLLVNQEIINIPAIVQASISGIKTINNIKTYQGRAYLSTGFGIVVINPERKEVADTYFPTGGNEPIIDVAFKNDRIFAVTKNSVFVGELSNNFLVDQTQWSVVEEISDYSATGKYNSIINYDNELYLGYNDEIYNSDTVFQFKNDTLIAVLDGVELFNLVETNNQLLICTDGATMVFNEDLEELARIYQYAHNSFPGPVDVVHKGDYYYIADRRAGLVRVRNNNNTTHITFEGPANASAYRVDWQNGTLAVVGGGVIGVNPTFSQAGGFVKQGEKWTSYTRTTHDLVSEMDFRDFISVAVNPVNTDQVAFGTYSRYPVLLSEQEEKALDTFTIENSSLENTGFGNGLSFVSDLVFDRSSNLWVLNGVTQRPLKVRSEEGVWFDYHLGSSASNKFTRRLVIDHNGVKWAAVDGAGIVAYDDKGTLEDESDDETRIINNGSNTGNLPSNTVYGLAVDHNNHLWIGTEEGIRVLYNTTNIFNADPGEYNAQQLLVEFGENVEVVLGGTHVTSIAIDGANRKWVGTENAGVFLFSSDGLSVVRNYTRQNSALLSNTILDLTIDQSNGEVYMVTDEGLISYRSDASRGDNSYSNVNVFPNPVYPDYFGPITIQGIAEDSDVRITDISGKLVYQTVSNGGTATWDGNTLQGSRATTGVYLIWTTVQKENAKGRKVGKVVFIN